MQRSPLAVSENVHAFAAQALQDVQARWGERLGAVSVIELGYLSSEFRGSINVDPLKNLCIPTIHECFFEFVPVEELDAPTAAEGWAFGRIVYADGGRSEPSWYPPAFAR